MGTNFINRAELQGRIGQDARISNVGETRVARFSMATNEAYKDRSGMLKEETTWHNIVAWPSKTVEDFSMLKKGVLVHVVGRMKTSRYKNSDGEDRFFNEIVALQLNLVEESKKEPVARE
ncbi:MAG: single-stranded DNA-binding protein [Bacteroidales bacterium]|nr:single-stranded DNA-binding protein [Bacteroidales bacterium]